MRFRLHYLFLLLLPCLAHGTEYYNFYRYQIQVFIGHQYGMDGINDHWIRGPITYQTFYTRYPSDAPFGSESYRGDTGVHDAKGGDFVKYTLVWSKSQISGSENFPLPSIPANGPGFGYGPIGTENTSNMPGYVFQGFPSSSISSPTQMLPDNLPLFLDPERGTYSPYFLTFNPSAGALDVGYIHANPDGQTWDVSFGSSPDTQTISSTPEVYFPKATGNSSNPVDLNVGYYDPITGGYTNTSTVLPGGGGDNPSNPDTGSGEVVATLNGIHGTILNLGDNIIARLEGGNGLLDAIDTKLGNLKFPESSLPDIYVSPPVVNVPAPIVNYEPVTVVPPPIVEITNEVTGDPVSIDQTTGDISVSLPEGAAELDTEDKSLLATVTGWVESPESRLSVPERALRTVLDNLLGRIPSVGSESHWFTVDFDIPYVGHIQKDFNWSDWPLVFNIRSFLVFCLAVFFAIRSVKTVMEGV